MKPIKITVMIVFHAQLLVRNFMQFSHANQQTLSISQVLGSQSVLVDGKATTVNENQVALQLHPPPVIGWKLFIAFSVRNVFF